MAVPVAALVQIGLAAASTIGNMAQASMSAKTQKEMLRIQAKQNVLDLSNAYLSSLDQLIQLKGSYRDTELSVLQTASDLESSQAWLDRYGDYYSTTMSQTYTSAMGQYQQLMANWQNQQVITAERGQTGTTAQLLASMQKQNLAYMFGNDLQVSNSGGLIGALIAEQQKDLAAEKETVQRNMGVGAATLELQQQGLDDLSDTFAIATTSAVLNGVAAGETQENLETLVDTYAPFMEKQEHITAEDVVGAANAANIPDIPTTIPEYKKQKAEEIGEEAPPAPTGQEIADKIKEEVIEPEFAPLEYRVTAYEYTYDRGDENSNLTGTDYKIQVKNDKGEFADATSKQIEQLEEQYYNRIVFNDYDKINAGFNGSTKGVNSDTVDLINLYAAENKIEVVPEATVKQEKAVSQAQSIIDDLSGKKFLDKDDQETLEWAEQQIAKEEKRKKEAKAKAAEAAKVAAMSEKESKKYEKQKKLQALFDRETEK